MNVYVKIIFIQEYYHCHLWILIYLPAYPVLKNPLTVLLIHYMPQYVPLPQEQVSLIRYGYY